MDFRILGPLEVRDGSRVLALGGEKQRALLAILLLHRGDRKGDGQRKAVAIGTADVDRAVQNMCTFADTEQAK